MNSNNFFINSLKSINTNKQQIKIFCLLFIGQFAMRFLGKFFWQFVGLFCVIFLGQVSYCQNSQITFENLSIRQGLSQSSVLALLQDRKGFLWAGTADGLNRYDGHKFKMYRKNLLDTTTLGNNYINALVEDTTGIIWVGTRGGLYAFSWKTEGFTKYLPDSTDTEPNHILTLAIDKQNNIWAGTLNGLYKLDQITKKITKIFPRLKDNFPTLGYQMIQTICFDNTGNYLWIGTEFGLFRYDIKHNTHIHYIHEANNSKSIPDNKISALFPDEYGNVWIGTYNGIISRWNRTSNDFLNLQLPATELQPYGSNKVKAFCKTTQGHFWVGTMSTGLYLVDETSGEFKFTNIKQMTGNMQALSDSDIFSLLEDDNGIFWVGTFGGGLHKHDTRQMLFNYYQPDITNSLNLLQKGLSPKDILDNDILQQNLLQNSIRAICEDSKNNLWIGNTNEGLIKFNNKAKTYTHYIHDAHNKNTIGSNKANAVYEDYQGVIWVGSTAGLSYAKTINDNGKEKEVFIRYVSEDQNKKQNQEQNQADVLLSNVIYTIKEDTEHKLWIGTRLGLACISADRKTSKTYTPDEKNIHAISGSAVRTIFFDDKNNKIWIGTFGGGVSLFDRKTEKFTQFRNTQNCKNCLSENSVSSIYLDNYGTVWIGTFGGGLNKFNIQKEEFSYITENEGLANNVVYGILEDGANHLWLSTNRGICRYDIISQQFINYTLTDGLQSDEFNANAYHKGKSGIFYFGGINGLTSFRPDSLQSAIKKYPILMTDFRLFNKSVKPNENSVLQQSITQTSLIELSYKDYVFAFEFAALNLSSPHRVRYGYKLQGFDRDWIYTTATDRVATYSNVPAGTYTFMVKATNSEGFWMEKQTHITVIIKPPFWNTIWFKVFSIVAVIFAFMMFYKYRMAQAIKYQKELEYEVALKTSELLQQNEEITQQNEEMEQQRDTISQQFNTIQKSEKDLAALNASKDKFFSILAHDLRSPLNSLGGFSSLLANFADEMSKEEIKEIANSLDKSVKISTKYLENLLTWAKSQMNSIEFKPENLNILKSVQTSVELLQTVADTKNIALICNIETDLCVFADANQLQTILTNLIANALKFTDALGTINIMAQKDTNKPNEFVYVEVMDTGVGMSADVMDKIFRIDSKHSTKGTAGETGTGLGLLLCKEFVEKNGGLIGVKSIENQGTTFYFTLPLGK